jgi:hypothetical protein
VEKVSLKIDCFVSHNLFRNCASWKLSEKENYCQKWKRIELYGRHKPNGPVYTELLGKEGEIWIEGICGLYICHYECTQHEYLICDLDQYI